MINGVNEGDVTNSDVLNAVFIYNIAELSLLVPYTRIKKKGKKTTLRRFRISDLFIYFLSMFQKNVHPNTTMALISWKINRILFQKGYLIHLYWAQKYFYRILEENMSKINDNNIKVNYYRVWMRNTSLINMVILG